MNESLNWSNYLEVGHRRCEWAKRIKVIELQVRLFGEITKKYFATIGEFDLKMKIWDGEFKFQGECISFEDIERAIK